jgi:hypothetical protein
VSRDYRQLAKNLEEIVNRAYTELRRLSEADAQRRPAPDAWSAKEIVGHLIDSASNNHQRFVRLQISDALSFPDYQQDNETWVTIQRYNEQPWEQLLTLWRHFNLHLSNIVRRVDRECLEHVWITGEDTSVTLGELMLDYLSHLNVHLDQIRVRMEHGT